MPMEVARMRGTRGNEGGGRNSESSGPGWPDRAREVSRAGLRFGKFAPRLLTVLCLTLPPKINRLRLIRLIRSLLLFFLGNYQV